MKTTLWISGALLAAVLVLAGCGKSDKSTAQRIPATMDITKFQQAFPAATPEQGNNIAKVTQGVRYRLYPDALAALNKLAADPTLTDPQKKAVNEMLQGIQQALTNAPASPPR